MVCRFKNSLYYKGVSVVLSLLILISVLPISPIYAVVATDDEQSPVMITVKDVEGISIEGATVEYIIKSDIVGYKGIKQTKLTDKNGCVEVLSSTDYINNDYTITATISKNGYKEVLLTDVKIAYAKIDITLECSEIEGLDVSGVDFTYNGNWHRAVSVTETGNISNINNVSYKHSYQDLKEDSDKTPMVRSANDYEFIVVVQMNDGTTYKKKVIAKVGKAKFDVPMERLSLVYNGEEQELLKVDKNAIRPGDEVSYIVNGALKNSRKVPTAKDAGEYRIRVIVSRGSNYENFDKSFRSLIAPDDINKEIEKEIKNDNFEIVGVVDEYTGDEQDAVEIIKNKANFKLKYKLDNGTWEDTIPKVIDAGRYTVYVKATKDNYTEEKVNVQRLFYAEETHNVCIAKARQDISFTNSTYNDAYVNSKSISIYLNDTNQTKTTYDFSATGGSLESEFEYSIVNNSTTVTGDKEIASISPKGRLTVRAAGHITVVAKKLGSRNYNEAVISCNVDIIDQSDKLISFDDNQVNYIFGENNGVVSNKQASKKYDDDDGKIKYSIDKEKTDLLYCNSVTGEIKIKDYDKLNKELEKNNGVLKATVRGDKDVDNEKVKITSVPVQPEGEIVIYFTNVNNWEKVYVHYWGKGTEKTEEMIQVKPNANGKMIYKCNISDMASGGNRGLTFHNGKSGAELKRTKNIPAILDQVNYYPVNDEEKCDLGFKNMTVDDLAEDTIVEKIKYAKDYATYTITISYANVPENPYSITGEQHNNSGWYTSKVTVTPSNEANYTISKVIPQTLMSDSFSKSVTFSDEGASDRYVYLRTSSGGITPKIKIEGLKIDTVPPDANNMKIEFSELTLVEKIGKFFGFCNPDVTITFTVDDENTAVESGIQYITWTYKREDGVASSILEEKTDTITKFETKGNTYIAETKLTADEAEQYRGKISFTATDNAGLESHKVVAKEDGIHDTIVVVDTISPNIIAYHQRANSEDSYNPVNKQHYYSGDVKFSIEVEEANFFKDDFNINIFKDDVQQPNVVIEWSNSSNCEIHTGTFVLSGDGDYKISMTYNDQSGNRGAYNSNNIVTDKENNKVVYYESEIITIDTIKPVLDFKFDEKTQSAKFIVTEHNFNPKGMSVETVAKNLINENVQVKDFNSLLENAVWEKDSKNEDKYSYIVKNIDDAIYDLKLSYEDLSKNPNVLEPNIFVIDSSVPTDIQITYSKPITETVLEALTFGFYKPNVTVTFTAYDLYSGVDYFTWYYTKQDGVSDINRPSDSAKYKVVAVQDNVDKSKFTAEVTLPDNEYKNLRGYITAYAKDKYNNGDENGKITDNNKIIVVDTITPTITVNYSPVSRTVGNVDYYNGNIDIKFNVKESNFFAEDVKVKVIKNSKVTYEITPSWKDISVDEHIGTYTLTNDGHYVITVEYKDRSSNEMVKYVSNMKTIDTIKPKIKVDYQNKNIINSLNDSENNKRDYYDNVQTAVVTITEHNFNANEVKLLISGKDVTGAKIPLDTLMKKSSWSDNGDVHKITITYSGDANYTFDADYTDLATNKANNYKPDYFTVDKTAPENLTVNYSTSVLETTLENITFGFYKAKMSVTITAEDQISKINNFNYSYIKADNVSNVNAQLLEQVIAEANVIYSNENRTATTTFEVPKEILRDDDQFNGTVEFTAEDRCGNTTNKKDTHRVVVDNISPTVTVKYNQAFNVENGISYYDGDIQGNITINEANFHSNDVSVMVSKDGGTAYKLNVSWFDNSVDVHTGTFKLTYDGNYIITVFYQDKSGNKMNTYKSNQLTIDTKIEKPVIRINGNIENGKAYKNNVIPAISFRDENFASYEVSLIRTRYGNKNVDVTKTFIGNGVTVSNKGGSGIFDNFVKVIENDGIYKLTVKMTDKAGHSSETTVDFTVNRFGSVYEYSDYLVSLIQNGGCYVSVVDTDLVITEYNADKLLENSVNIEITRDGKPLSDVKYEASPTVNSKVGVGISGWYQYEYTISKENFTLDGVYKISVSSKDATGNLPENTNYDGKDILFRVDSTSPEITSVVGLETKIINSQETMVKYTIFDTIGLKCVKIFVNGKQLGDEITEFNSDMNNYIGNFVINESDMEQTVRFVIEDLAGNITDTDAETFTCAYAFEKAITVSTNMFVRWYANKVIFWGSIGGFVAVTAAIIIAIIILVKKRKKDNE